MGSALDVAQWGRSHTSGRNKSIPGESNQATWHRTRRAERTPQHILERGDNMSLCGSILNGGMTFTGYVRPEQRCQRCEHVARQGTSWTL